MEYLAYLIIAWLFWPGLFIIIAAVFESRIPPLWTYQARAFLPGEFTIAIMFLAFLQDAGWKWSKLLPKLDWSLAVFLLCLAIAFWRQRDDWSYYMDPTKSCLTSRRSVMSPSKWAHDIVGYYLTIPLVAVNGVRLFSHWNKWAWLFLVALLFYGAVLAWDIKNPASSEDAYARQPDDWQPIWKADEFTWTRKQWHRRIWNKKHIRIENTSP